MKTLLIFIITIYQDYVSLLLRLTLGPGNGCRYEVTCSEYAKQAIATHGIKKGLYLSVKRVLSCQPLLKKHYAAL